jgi:hypothetical protein
MFQDWYIFYQAGRAISEGISPYSVAGYFNPIQAAWLLSFTTWLPFQAWAWTMVALSFAGILIIARKRAIFYVLSAPFIFGAFMGMLDVFLWIPARLGGGLGLALLTLKPQLAMIYVPFRLMEWKRQGNIRQIVLFFTGTALLWGIPAMFSPGWVTEWIHSLPTLTSRMHGAASFPGYIVLFDQPIFFAAIFAIVMAWFLIKGNGAYYLAAAFSPSFSPVDFVIMSEFSTWRFTVLSWALAALGVGIDTMQFGRGSQALFLLGILIYFEQRAEKSRIEKQIMLPAVRSVP